MFDYMAANGLHYGYLAKATERDTLAVGMWCASALLASKTNIIKERTRTEGRSKTVVLEAGMLLLPTLQYSCRAKEVFHGPGLKSTRTEPHSLTS